MWTLEGLGALDAACVARADEGPNPRMRVQAIRASENAVQGRRQVARGRRSRAAAKDPDPDVALQALLTLNVLKVGRTAPGVIQATRAANKARGVQGSRRELLLTRRRHRRRRRATA